MKRGGMTAVIFLLFCHIPVYGLISASLEGTGGIFSCQSQEHVLENNSGLSRLDWQDPVIPLLTLRGKLESRGFFLGGGILTAVPVQSGLMKDYDFLIPGSDAVSHYSQHNAYLDKHFDVTTELGYTYAPPYAISIALSGGFLYRNLKWTAANGYIQYPDTGEAWTGNEPQEKITGPVISYEQAVWFPFIAIEFNSAPFYDFKQLEFSIKSYYYPYIWAETADTHFLRAIQFYDTLRGGLGYKLEAAVRFYFDDAKKSAVIINGGYEWINVSGTTASGPTGITSQSPIIDEGYSSKMESGTWYVSLGFSYSFKDIF